MPSNQPAFTEVLAPSLTLGPITLSVQNIQIMKQFYAEVIGLSLIAESVDRVTLGFKKTPLVILQQSDLQASHPRSAGLYHLAILFTSQRDLAHAVKRVVEKTPDLFSGSGDHLVSEAFYLTDPEGNGVELYYDRDRSVWQWEDGLVKMDSLYIPLPEYINTHAMTSGAHDGMQLGHVHLKVGDIQQAKKFYIDILGFTITSHMPSALFMSIGGYHHHLGMNTWESSGAKPRSDSLGLHTFEIVLPAQENLDALKERLKKAAVSFEEISRGILFKDPWNNSIHASVQGLE